MKPTRSNADARRYLAAGKRVSLYEVDVRASGGRVVHSHTLHVQQVGDVPTDAGCAAVEPTSLGRDEHVCGSSVSGHTAFSKHQVQDYPLVVRVLRDDRPTEREVVDLYTRPVERIGQVVEVKAYSRLINDGWCPTWTGVAPGETEGTGHSGQRDKAKILVRLGKGQRHIWSTVEVSFAYDATFEVLYKRTAVSPGGRVGLLPYIGSEQSIARAAAVCGIAPFTSPGYGVGRSIPSPSVIRLVGLDIEQSTAYRGDKFPLPEDPLISIAIVTWDNRYFCRYVPGWVNQARVSPTARYDVARVASSEELASWAIEWIVRERPDFVAIHNAYAFDVPRLAAHCAPSLRHYFRKIGLGKTAHGIDLCVPGVTVIDTYLYLDKLHRSEYESTSLDSLAKHCSEPGKLSHPPLSLLPSDTTTDVTEVVIYNIHDSYLHLKVAIRMRCLEEIIIICPIFKCPVSDACRFIDRPAI